MKDKAKGLDTLSRSEALARLWQEMQPIIPPGRAPVFGDGNPEARLSIIGEAPGPEEEVAGRPFIGAAGRLLNRLLEEVALPRRELWVTNVVKWRPLALKQGKAVTRAPLLSEVRFSQPWLQREMDIIRPRFIVCLGNVAARVIIAPSFQITKEHGRWFAGPGGAQAMATFHPSYVLHLDEGAGLIREMMRQDLLTVKKSYDGPD